MYNSYIDGKLVRGLDGVQDILNPGDESIAGTVTMIDESQAEEALLSAQKGYEFWSSITLNERITWIEKLQAAIESNREAIIDILIHETGKLLDQASEDYQMLVDCLTFYPDEALKMEDEIIKDKEDSHLNIMTKEPLGVVVAYLAWNFPLLNLGYKLGPSLASGCSCIIKPSMSTPLATLKIGEILESIEFPKGVVNIVSGNVGRISTVFNESDIPQLITLIGSTNTGKLIVGQSNTSVKRFSLELGGNAPAIVLKDYDPIKAAQTLTPFKFNNCGQVCVSPNRIFVHEDHYETFVEEVLRQVSKMTLGWGYDETAHMAPMINERSRDRMFTLIEDATTKGGTLLYGGVRPESMDKGYYIMPTVIGDVTEEMTLYQEEVFGPIMSLIKYSDEMDLVKAGNDTEYGLTSYVFTNDLAEIKRFTRGLISGTVCINQPKYAVELPHGGTKQSGIGKDCSKYSLEEYYYIKRISIALNE